MLDALLKRRPGPRLATLRGPAHVLPDFLLIGVQKGGTTSLYHYLAQHPDVLGVGAKELFYFDRRYALGENWYRCWFPTHGAMKRARAAADGRTVLTGEASTSYLDHPAVPLRSARLVPEAKVVAVLRDPAERALSHYFHNRRKGREPLDILDAFRAEPERLAGEAERALADPAYESEMLMHFNYLSRGHYAEHLERWAEHYPQGQTLVLRSEDLFERPAEVFSQTLAFLGLEQWQPESFPVRNPGTNRREVADEVRAFLDDHYAPHNARLGAMLGPEFDWSAR
ncbi:MAG: sulfotransferase domain-containing protein [Bacteroidota bacterium]